jgi:hypothetical protein
MTQKTKKVLEWIAFSFLGLVLLVSGSLFLYQRAYAGKIYPGVSVAGIDLSGKTKSQARTLLDKKISNIQQKELLLKAGNKEIPVKVADTGLSYDTNKTVNNAYAIGRNSKFLLQLWSSVRTLVKKNTISPSTIIDQEKFKSFSDANLPNLSQEAKNAELKIGNGVVSTVTESSGQSVDTVDLADKILELANKDDSTQSYNITLKVTAVNPVIITADLSTAKQFAESTIAKTVTLTYEGQTYRPSKADIGNWIFFSVDNSKYNAGLNDNTIKAYLTNIAKNFEIQKVDRKVNASNNEVIEQGRDGKYLEKDKALASIKSQLQSQNSITVALATYDEPAGEVKVFPAEGIVPGRFPGKYIDIDLSQQKLCTIEGNNILGCYTVSTGKSSTPTPKGTRTIQDKNPMAWSAPYGLYMPYWNGMGGGYGIHELPEWPGGFKEGESHLGIPVSHGCVRLGVGPAQTVYNWADIGTPVYIH